MESINGDEPLQPGHNAHCMYVRGCMHPSSLTFWHMLVLSEALKFEVAQGKSSKSSFTKPRR